MFIFEEDIDRLQIASIKQVIGFKPNKGQCCTGKYMVLMKGLIGLSNG